MIKSFVVLAAVLLTACATLQSYVEPTGADTAELKIKNNALEPLGLHIYENAKDCSNKRRVIWMDAGKELSIRIKAPEETAYSLNTEHMAGSTVDGQTISINTEFCLSIFSFHPKANGKYRIVYDAVPGGCKTQAPELAGGVSNPLAVTRRTFVRPLSEDGAFCAPQVNNESTTNSSTGNRF